MRRRIKRPSSIERWKRDRLAEGWGCAVCQVREGLEAVHVVPAAVGGSDEGENLLLLCQAHHKEHHRLFHFRRGVWYGPRGAAELVTALSDPEAWFERRKRDLVNELRG